MTETETHTAGDEPPKGVIVLGGGLTGLYAGLVLARTGSRVTVLEAEEDPGGRIRGHRVGQNTFTLGTHLLQSFDKEIYEDATGLLTQRAVVDPSENIKWGDQKAPYPLSFESFLKGLPLGARIAGTAGKSSAALGQKLAKKAPLNAEQALSRIYGSSLTKHCLSKWVELYFGKPGKDLSPESLALLYDQLPPTSNFDEAIKALGVENLPDSSIERTTPEESTYFPGSSAALAQALAGAIQSEGGRVICNAEVVGLEADDGEIKAIRCRDTISDSEEPTIHDLPCSAVISTLPVRKLVKAFGTQAPAQIHASSLHLLHRAHVCFCLLLNRSTTLEEISLQVRDQPFFRLSEPKNAGQQITPTDQTILLAEASTDINSPYWNGDEQVWSEILDAIEALGLAKRDEVVSRHHLRDAVGMPVYRLEFEEHRARLFGFFSRFKNLECAGPSATFSLARPDRAMRLGKEAAERIQRTA